MTTRFMRNARSLPCWAFPLLVVSCLPKDTRPPPGKVLVTATADDALARGATTDDGWTLSYERFLISVGHASAEGDSCTQYSDPDYSRVLAMLRPEAQKVSLMYALGACDFDFELSSPHEDSVLGEGATDADKTFMRTPGDDAYATGAAISIYVAGHATKDGIQKHFEWAYRNRIDYASCSTDIDGADVQGFEIGEKGSISLDLLVRGLALFESDRDGDKFLFQPFADADGLGDGNGEVTLDELALVNLAELAAAYPDAGLYTDRPAYAQTTATEGWSTLRDYVYLARFPMVIRYRGNGTCAMEVFPNDREPR